MIGLSKLNRIVEWFARRPQVQENLTMQIHKHIDEVCEGNKGVGVLVEANHMCACVRGVKHDSIMKTAKLSGKFKDTDLPISVIENLNHITRVLKTGATKQAYKMSELIELINTYLENPHFDRENRKKLVEREITANIGYAGKSIGNFIYSLI